MDTHRPARMLVLGLVAAPLVMLAPTVSEAQTVAHAPRPTPAAPEVVRYGGRVHLGNGEARSYITVDARGRPTEIGVALGEAALDGLPATGIGHHGAPPAAAGPHGAHQSPHVFLLDLPEQAGVPFRFVELNWNPAGHEPTGVYEGVPHFDFHFYTIDEPEREAISPKDPEYPIKANRLPAEEYVPEFNAALGPPGAEPAQIAVPLMGVHWVDLRSPELQALLGKPEAFEPFTRTFIHGSWDGRWIFWEPMITRVHLLEKKTTTDPAVRDEIVPIPLPSRYQAPGYYPEAYRITWDPEAGEYRIALTQLVQQR